jgi:hypothetical protein
MWLPRSIRKRLAWAAVASVMLPWTVGEWVKRWQQTELPLDPMRGEMMVDFIVAGCVLTGLILVFTVGVGCWVVAVMQGPRFTADSFPVDSPRD